jgi:hypothetical protein
LDLRSRREIAITFVGKSDERSGIDKGETMLTDEQVEKITAREAKATKGPWKCHTAEFTKRGVNFELSMAEKVLSFPDAKFLENSRTDIPALLDDRKEMRKLLREAVKVIEFYRHPSGFTWTGDGYAWDGAESDYRCDPRQKANEFLANTAVQELVK